MDLAVLLTEQETPMPANDGFFQQATATTAANFVSPGSNDTASLFDEYAANTQFQQLQGELRELLFTGAISTAPTRQHSPREESIAPQQRRQRGHHLLLQHLTSAQDQIPLATKIRYLNNWGTEIAPWLDMFDQQKTFGIQVPILAQTSPSVLYAMLAISARQMERRSGVKGGSSHDSLKLYSEAIGCLAPILNPREPAVLVTACILCVLEMMSVRPSDWRRHLEGCTALFEASGVHGFSGGLPQAVLWCYARMDLCGAIIADGAESTVLPLDRWVNVGCPVDVEQDETWTQRAVAEEFIVKGQLVPDMHANYAVYLCTKVYDLLTRRTRYVELGQDNDCNDTGFLTRWQQLWNELQNWYTYRPREMLPVQEIAANGSDLLFPRILFAHWAAISGNQLYHTACIVMLETSPAEQLIVQDTSLQARLWHARRVVGISLSNDHPGCLNNAVQPLWVAGKLFSHREEQEAIVGVIDEIEARTGWGTRWRIRDLEAAWGYTHGTFRQVREIYSH